MKKCKHGSYWRDCPVCFRNGCNPPDYRERDTEISALRAQLAEAKQEILKRDSEIARVREDMRLRLRAKNDHTAELKAEIERLKDELTESESAHKEALIARLREERNDLPSPTEDRSDQNEPNQEPDSTES